MTIHVPRTLSKTEWPPDYVGVYNWRFRQLAKFKKDREFVRAAWAYYSENPWDFINHWVDTHDPRYAMSETMPTTLPLVMFERQEQYVRFLLSCMEDSANGAVDKSRTMGATWIACSFSVWLWVFRPGAAVGWGSRKQELVDRVGDPKSIFDKLRRIIDRLPREFWPAGFSREKHMTFMKIINPSTDASIAGEAGDNIGRGGRTSIYFKDESAHYEHPEAVEAALGENTRCQIDISTHNGIGTVFDRKINAGRIWLPDQTPERGVTRIFVLDWRDHPEMTQEWHDLREKEYRANGLLHVFRQEVDRDAAASLQGIIIPPEWVRSAVDAHLTLGFGDDGIWGGALDVADEGGDLNALTFRKGVVLYYADDWGEGDTGVTTRRTIAEAATRQPVSIQYDCIGVGAGVKSEANRLSREIENGKPIMPRHVHLMPWNAGAAVLRPEERVIPADAKSPKNKDFYGNVKAQGWWGLRRRFEKVHRMRTEGLKYPASELVSLSSKIPKLEQLKRELSQPVIGYNGRLAIIVDNKPEGAKSPNMADSVMMNYFPIKLPMHISADAMQRAMQR